jgi:3',5'-cyclic AMP phosphodiesterase CpdA
MATPLATFLQISDLHFGHVDQKNVTGPYNAEMPAKWAKCRLFRGLFGHQYLALEQLVKFVGEQRQIDGKMKLLVTGDLTSCGNVDQFLTASDFLGNVLKHPKGLCGLNWKDWNDWAIPGNHDHWPGTGKVTGVPSPGLAGSFPKMHRSWELGLGSGYKLRFYSINTDADVKPKGVYRRLAVGHFTSQLAAVERDFLTTREPKEIRILLLHHSRRFGSPIYRQPLVTCKHSRKALDEFLVKLGISIILCGHTHVPRIRDYTAKHRNGQQLKVMEGCCGTTTQWDSIPFQWTNLWGSYPSFSMESNTLLRHRIIQDGGKLVWEPRVFQRHSGGFVPMTKQPKSFQIWP